MGGGVSIGFHHKGKVVDVNHALGGEGPFSPNAPARFPPTPWRSSASRANTRKRSAEDDFRRRWHGEFLGTNDMRDVEKLHREGDPAGTLYYNAFIYQVGKAIGALAAAAHGAIDAIILTGGIAYGKEVVEGLGAMCSFIAPIVVYPGEGELEALAKSGFGAVTGRVPVLEYQK